METGGSPPTKVHSDPGVADFWQRLAARSQSNLYFALAFLPARRREAFRDVYRFLRAADDVADAGDPPEVARARLAGWRRELDAVYAGHATHPIARRLADAVARFGLTRTYFETILDALEDDVGPRRIESYAELERFCEAIGSTLGYLCLEILGVSGAPAVAYAHDLGSALQLANIVRDVAEDAARGRVYLPADELRAAGTSPEEVLAGHASPGLFRVVAVHVDRVRALVRRARAPLPPAFRRKLVVPEIWADVYLALMDEIAACGYDVTRRPVLRRRRKLKIAVTRWIREELRDRTGAPWRWTSTAPSSWE